MNKIQYIPPTSSSLAIVGEAPGADEVASGVPFVGAEGQFYQNKILKPAGVHYSARAWYDRKEQRKKAKVSGDVYVTNVAQHKPPKNKFELLSQDQKILGKETLKNDLTAWQKDGLNAVIAVGAKSLEALTGKTKISELRGTVLESTLVPGLKVIPSIHPGNLFRGNHKMEPIVKLDHEYALKEAAFPEIRLPEMDIHIIRERLPAIHELEKLTGIEDLVVCDIETNTRSMLTAFGIATSPQEAIVLTKETLKYPDVIRALSEFCISETPKVYHNVLFDVFFLAYYYQIVNRNFQCSMLAQHSVYPTLPKSLAFCSSIYTHAPYWKDEGKEGIDNVKKGKQVDWDSLYIYCGKDCCLTYDVWKGVNNEIDDWGARKIFNFMMDLTDPCLCAMMKGTATNLTADKAYAKKNERAIEILEDIKDKTISPNLNVKSNVQLKELIYTQWDMPKQYKQGKLTTEAKKLKKLETFPTPYKLKIGLIRVLNEHYNERQFYNITTDYDGRIRTALKIHGAYTGRFASSKSITGSGRNLQNVPKQLRKAYVPDEGCIFINRDLSQAEARIVAALCGDRQWLRDFDETDQHSKVASMIFDIPFDRVDKNLHRQPAKRVAHASHYLLGPGLLSEILGIPMKKAKELKDKYFNFRYSLYDWHERVRKMLYREKHIVTHFGRIIQFFGPVTDALIREAVAAEPQSTSGDYLNKGIIDFHQNLPREYQFLLQVHDSVLSQNPDNPSLTEEIFLQQTELMRKEMTINGITFHIPLDGEIGYSWGDMVEVKGDLKAAREEAWEKFCKSQEENLQLLKAV